MISIAVEDVKTAIQFFPSEIKKQSQIIHKNLTAIRKKITDKLKIKYIDSLLADAHMIIAAEPWELDILKVKYEAIIDTKLLAKGKYAVFRETIIKALAYSDLRSNFYPEYFYKIGIKTCIYCNSQLAITVVRNSSSEYRAKFQVDHYLPKNEYPCFSISLFNLYPVCASCNNVKGSKKVLFSLYQQRSSLGPSVFKFSIGPGSKGLFLLNRKIEDLKIVFKQPDLQEGFEDYNKLFDIQSIYETQKDIVEELLLKAETYSPAYKKTLLKNFNVLFKRKDILDRLIIGNYTEEKDIHKRPLAKFMMDISTEIGLIIREESDINDC